MTTTVSNSLDLLVTNPSALSFDERVRRLRLSTKLTEKAIKANALLRSGSVSIPYLSTEDEKELSSEVLLQRHQFTDLIFRYERFRQAAISVIQNIYLFRDRKIFFGSGKSGEQERQEALLLLTDNTIKTVPLAKAFQHNILARIWGRLVSTADERLLESESYEELQEVVSNLNTLRNIYMALTTRLVGKLTRNINDLYKQSITHEDAYQIGSFGVAKASYRFHHSSGYRFSTYASHWVQKEIQRQALDGRLIKVSSHLIEKLSKYGREGNVEEEKQVHGVLEQATAHLLDQSALQNSSPVDSQSVDPVDVLENKHLLNLVGKAVDSLLSEKGRDVIRRRYGLPPYEGQEQTIIDIAKEYGVTRGAVYQLEDAAMKKLNAHLQIQLSNHFV